MGRCLTEESLTGVRGLPPARLPGVRALPPTRLPGKEGHRFPIDMGGGND